MSYHVRGVIRIDLRAREGRMFDDCEVEAVVPGYPPAFSAANAAREVLYMASLLSGTLPCWWLRGPEVRREEGTE